MPHRNRENKEDRSRDGSNMFMEIDYLYFKNADRRSVYERSYLHHEVCKGKVVSKGICDDLGLDTYNYFSNIGWGDFVSLQLPCYPKLVQIFYAHIEDRSPRSIISYAKGVEFHITKHKLRTIIIIIKGDVQYYSTKFLADAFGFDPTEVVRQLCGNPTMVVEDKFPASQMILVARLLHNIIHYTIMPKTGRNSDVSRIEVFIIWCILNGKKLDLSHIIYMHMLKCWGKTKACYYLIPLTKIFQHVGVMLEGEDSRPVDPVTEAFGTITLKQMGLEMVNGQWIGKPTKASHSVPDASRHTSDDDKLANVDVHSKLLLELIAKVDAMSAKALALVDDQSSLLRELIEKVKGLSGKVDNVKLMQEEMKDRIKGLEFNFAEIRRNLDLPPY